MIVAILLMINLALPVIVVGIILFGEISCLYKKLIKKK